MANQVRADICVIGAGSGGLSVAAGASQMGADVVLIEAARMGGDCLNYGCVPSKAMLAAAHRAHAQESAAPFGLDGGPPRVRFGGVQDHVQEVIQSITPHDSEARFAALGVRVIRAHAAFIAADAVQAGESVVRARRFVIATGSRPLVPPIPGLAAVPYLTNETVFENRVCPAHLIVVGGGPVGLEMAQAHRRLGARVTVVEMAAALAKDDPELAEVALTALRREGIEILERTRVDAVAAASGGGVAVRVTGPDGARTLSGSHLLVAAGRAATVAGLGLEAAGIAYSARGIQVDRRLRTTNRRAYAIGDVVGSHQFTHMAAYHAGIVMRNLLFRLPARVDDSAVPWVTFTDPELAQVGLTEATARARHGAIRVLRWPYGDNDRARAERATAGLVKVITTPRGRVLGAGIVGAHAGELIQPWCLMIARRLPIAAMASLITPYPTLAEISKRAAGSYFTPALFGDRTRRLVRFLLRFP
ncbi:MAG: dihydrolipoamide dehydrogenase [Alphaproteobacteria bacterium]|nr:dihydrolipoamide dehydrogenase [Alphaproteobacteria bacterium]